MLNVFMKKSAEELYVELSNGRMIPLEDLVRDYERLLNLKKVAKSEPNHDKSTVSKLKVGEWFRIDREIIDKSKEKIRRMCNGAGREGKALWERFAKSNKIADENPSQYPCLIETYIFPHSWNCETEQEMRDICGDIGDGMCCEVICDLELQMRICNGEQVDDLVKKADKLPCARAIKLRNGGTGYFGGGTEYADCDSPASLHRHRFIPDYSFHFCTPYAFRRVLSKN